MAQGLGGKSWKTNRQVPENGHYLLHTEPNRNLDPPTYPQFYLAKHMGGFKKFGPSCWGLKKLCIRFLYWQPLDAQTTDLPLALFYTPAFTHNSQSGFNTNLFSGCKDIAFSALASTPHHNRVTHGTHLLDPLPQF